MAFPSDIEIARQAKLKEIAEIADSLGIPKDSLKPYGWHMAKVDHNLLNKLKDKEDGKLVLVTAITPTPAGEGKTTTSIGLSMALNKLGKKSIVALREPSLGPVMGVKGGAAGGGYSQVLPMEEINLHFTGDIHAVAAAHNLLSAMIDAHIKFGNKLNIDPTRVFWKRTVDMNDRALRQIVIGLGGRGNGEPREDGFIITAASEVMAILCLASGIKDLKERLSSIVIARKRNGELVRAGDLKAQNAMALLLKDAINPNLVQTIENTPAFVHGGPFANIAHGTNSIIATKLALKLAPYVVTEAGFGADLGAEKFLDFVSPTAGFKPSAVVLVATIRALKYHGGQKLEDAKAGVEDLQALEKGIENLKVHIENLLKFKIPVVVALNRFLTDTDREIEFVMNFVEKMGVKIALNEAFAKGGEGAEELAKKVLEELEKGAVYEPIYRWDMPIEEKIEILAKEIYRAGKVEYTSAAKSKLKFLKKYGFDKLPLIMAKTQASLTDDPKKLGAPQGYTFTIRDFEISAGAGFVVALAGDILRMPGLPKVPNATKLDILEDGTIIGLS
ncbi:MAG: formate--tetrahydrofolate ligase [Thermotogaceae bacterium]|nr:formate--tetrahydrofolate ligase [Thermotogaceae bacterium]